MSEWILEEFDLNLWIIHDVVISWLSSEFCASFVLVKDFVTLDRHDI
jgi:hypothetical protein